MLGGLAFGYLLLMVLFFIIGVLILRWVLRINTIVKELELIRKALVVAYDLEEIRDLEDKIKDVSKNGLKEANKAKFENLRAKFLQVQKEIDASKDSAEKARLRKERDSIYNELENMRKQGVRF